MGSYVVTAGYVTVETELPGGGRANVDVQRGKVLPADVPQAQVETELRLGTIEEIRATAPATPEPEVADGPPPLPAPVVPPGMSVSATEEWVKEGGEQAVERAKSALEVELAAVDPRKTLVARLEAVIAAAESSPSGE